MNNRGLKIGQRIRTLRKGLKISIEELSFRAKISAAHLGQIERGTKNPTVATVDAIANGLKVPTSILFSDEYYEDSPHNLVLEKINAHLIDMNEDEQKAILKIIYIFESLNR